MAELIPSLLHSLRKTMVNSCNNINVYQYPRTLTEVLGVCWREVHRGGAPCYFTTILHCQFKAERIAACKDIVIRSLESQLRSFSVFANEHGSAYGAAQAYGTSTDTTSCG